jgi:hypothetical protein
MKQGQQVLWADEDVTRLRKPEGVGRSSLGSSVSSCRCPGRGDAVGAETSREEPTVPQTTSVVRGIEGRSVSGAL